MERIFVALVSLCMISVGIANKQGDILYALRTSLNASTTQLADWDPSLVNPCTWLSVICDYNNQVTYVDLTSMNFSGYITPKIGGLDTLIHLDLNGNGINGKIPMEIGNLSSLKYLDLGSNNIIGEIPNSLGNLRNLEYLILSNNNLTGPVRNSLSNIPNLISLQLDSNQLSGHVPAQLYATIEYNFTGNNLDCGENSSHLCASNDNIASMSSKSIFGMIGGIVRVLLVAGLLIGFV